MKCFDCGKDACVLLDNDAVLKFAFCKECIAKRRNKKQGWLGEMFKQDGLWEELDALAQRYK